MECLRYLRRSNIEQGVKIIIEPESPWTRLKLAYNSQNKQWWRSHSIYLIIKFTDSKFDATDLFNDTHSGRLR